MKRLLSILTVSLLTICAANAAPGWDLATLLSGGTQNIPAGGTSNYTATANVRYAETAGIYMSYKLTGAGTDNIIFKFSKSVDGSNYEGTPSVLITNAANGTTAVHHVTTQSVVGLSDLKLASIVNGSSGEAITNLVVKIGIKNVR